MSDPKPSNAIQLTKCLASWSKPAFEEDLKTEVENKLHTLDMEPYLKNGGGVTDGPNVEKLEIDEKTATEATGFLKFQITESIHTSDPDSDLGENHVIEARFTLNRATGTFTIEESD